MKGSGVNSILITQPHFMSDDNDRFRRKPKQCTFNVHVDV